MNEKIEVPTMQVPPLKKICMTIGQLPSSYLETMSYYEMLVWFVNYLRDDIIPVVNANGQATHELQELYVELKEYVDNYLTEETLQPLVNNKLNEMLESGELEQIIEQFIQSSTLWCFDSVNDLKLATNLIDGSYARTVGYYAANDGGGAIYKIRTKTNADTTNDMDLIQLNDETLVAELVINDTLNIKQIGAKADNSTNNSSIFQYAVNTYYGKIILIPEGTYIIDNPINIFNSDTTLKGCGYQKTIIKKTSETTGDVVQRIYNDAVYNFNERPTAINIIFPNNSESANINISDLSISLGLASSSPSRTKIGIHAPRVVFSNFHNIRISNAYSGILIGGWINKLSQIDMLNNYPYAITTPDYGLIATTIEKCDSTIGTNRFKNCTNIVLNDCSADDGDPCYYFISCKSGTLNSCSTETNAQCIIADNSYVVINSGDYEGHSVQNLATFKGFFTFQNGSEIKINNPYIHFADYGSYGNPNNKNIFTLNAANVKGYGKISTPYTHKNYVYGSNAYVDFNDEVKSLNQNVLNVIKTTITGNTKTEIARLPFEYGKRLQVFVEGYGQKQYFSVIYSGLITAVHYESPVDIDVNVTAIASVLGGEVNPSITAEYDSTNAELVIYYNSRTDLAIPMHNTIKYNANY